MRDMCVGVGAWVSVSVSKIRTRLGGGGFLEETYWSRSIYNHGICISIQARSQDLFWGGA